MPIIELISSALTALKRHDQPKIEALQAQESLTEEEERFLDVTSNYTELATLLQDLSKEDDPEAAYAAWRAAGRTGEADSSLAEAAKLQRADDTAADLSQAPASPQANLQPPSPSLRRSPRERSPRRLSMESVAIPTSPANPTGLPGHRGWNYIGAQPPGGTRSTQTSALRSCGLVDM